MKRRETDERDQISDKEVKDNRIPWYKAFKLFIVNLPTIAKVVMLVIGVWGGTMAAPEAYRIVSEIATGETTVPKGQTLTPDPNAPSVVWQGQVDISLTSQKNAIDVNTGAVEALRAEIVELEGRLAAQRNRGDANVSERVTANEEEINILKGIVQP